MAVHLADGVCCEVVVTLLRFDPAEGNVGNEETFYCVALFQAVFEILGKSFIVSANGE